MPKLNWPRIVLCGLLAGLVWNLLAIILLTLVGDAFLAAVRGGRPTVPRGGIPVGFVVNLAAAVWAMWLYAAIRRHYGPGPRTAVVAGVAWWVIVSLQSAKWVVLEAVPSTVVLAPLAATLPAILLASLVGAWAYKE